MRARRGSLVFRDAAWTHFFVAVEAPPVEWSMVEADDLSVDWDMAEAWVSCGMLADFCMPVMSGPRAGDRPVRRGVARKSASESTPP